MRLIILGVVIGAGLITANFYWKRYFIPSGAMKPTLLIGDHILTEPLWETPVRGDVVVFRHPTNNNDFIFRVVGLPGDRLQLSDGQVFLNDAAIEQIPSGVFSEVMEPQGVMGLTPRCRNGAVGIGAVCEKDLLIETLPEGKSYSILNVAVSPVDTTGVYSVPADQYFVLGDNRDNANDSRFLPPVGYGFVPRENIHRRVVSIIFSAGGRDALDVTRWRTERFGMAIE